MEVRIKVEFSELFQKALRKMKQFWKPSINGELNFIKRPKKASALRAPKSLVFLGCCLHNLHGQT